MDGGMDFFMSDIQTIDARGKRCPLPVLMAKRAINEGPLSENLEIWVTDRSAPQDFDTFARLEGHTVTWEQRDEMVAITLRLKSPASGAKP